MLIDWADVVAMNTGGRIPGEVEDARLWSEDTSSYAPAEGSGRHCGAQERQSWQWAAFV